MKTWREGRRGGGEEEDMDMVVYIYILFI